MKKNLKFSIITVCLNERASIRKTCESICSQVFQNFEWIVIDGASSDGTLDVLSEFNHRINCLVSEPDNGIYGAMNKGIHRAKGEYLLFLNAGDYLADNNVLEAVSRSPDRDILCGDLLCMTESGEGFVKSFPDVLPRHFLLKNMMPHQASFIKRELFNRYGEYDTSLRIAGDYDLFVRLLYVHSVSYFHVPRTLAVFQTDGISSGSSHRALRKRENHQIRKKYFPWFIYGLKGLKTECKFRFGYNVNSR